MDWKNFYIGNAEDADCRLNARISYSDCNMKAETTLNEIIYSNVIAYQSIDGFNFFNDFIIKCAIPKNLNLSLDTAENVIDISNISLIQDMREDLILSDHVELILIDIPEGKFLRIK